MSLNDIENRLAATEARLARLEALLSKQATQAPPAAPDLRQRRTFAGLPPFEL